jgi:heterodisulfide reductase subunit C
MVDFGYTINKDSQIDFDLNDRFVNNFVLKMEPSFALCINCGSCSATCTTGNFTDFNIRKIITLIKRGQKDEVRYEIKKCMLCGKCKLICPRGVNTRNVIFQISKALH